MDILLASVCSPHVCSSLRVQKVSDPLKLELRMVVSYYLGAGNQTWVFWRSGSTLSHGAISLQPHLASFSSQVSVPRLPLRCLPGNPITNNLSPSQAPPPHLLTLFTGPNTSVVVQFTPSVILPPFRTQLHQITQPMNGRW